MIITVDYSEGLIEFAVLVLERLSAALCDFVGPIDCVSQLLLPVDSLYLRLELLVFINQLLYVFLAERLGFTNSLWNT